MSISQKKNFVFSQNVRKENLKLWQTSQFKWFAEQYSS